VDLITSRGSLRSVLDRVLGFLCASTQEARDVPVRAEVAAGAPEPVEPEAGVAAAPSAELGHPEPERQIGRHGPA
jgi:hypothetical protein